MRDPVIITGTPRSGLWLVAGAFVAAGGFGGLIDVGVDRVGTMETIPIRDRLERPLLEGLGYDPRGIGTIPPSDQIAELAQTLATQWRTLVDDSFAQQGYPNDAIRFITSQVACLLWPLWRAAFPEAQWIIVRRYDPDIAASCRATIWASFYRDPNQASRRERTEEEFGILLDSYKAHFTQMRTAGLRTTLFWPQQVFDGNLGTLRSLLESHGLVWKPEVAEYCRPLQWKHGALEIKK